MMERRILLSAYTLSQLATFGANASGAYPRSTLVVDSNGNFYGTTDYGGASGDGAVFEIAKGSSTITPVASFNGANGANPYAGVTLDASGNLYGTTYHGGVGNDGTVFEIAKGSGTVTTLASFNVTNGANPYAGVTLDASGNLYGTTRYGGASNDGTVFEIAKGSGTITTLASFNGTDGAIPFAGVTLDPSGNLYGTTHLGGANNLGTVFEIAKGSDTITTLVAFNGTNGGYPTAGVTLDASGNLYGTTASGEGTVFEIAKGSGTITTLASFNGANGETSEAGVTLDASGNLYGTTGYGGPIGDGTVFEIAKGSSTVMVLASFNGTNGANPFGGVTFDAAGNLYGTTENGGGPSNHGTVFEIAKGSGTITTVAPFNGNDGAEPGAAVTLDASGNLYGTTEDGGASGDGTVFEIARGSGTVTALASFDGANGAYPAAGVTLDASGNLYGTTAYGGASNDGTVFEIARGSGTITTLASFNLANGAAPYAGVRLDASGNLYGATEVGGASGDGGDGTVFEIAKGSGTITTLASFNLANGSYPAGGVTLDAFGNLYGTTTFGGALGDGTVFEIANGSGTITTLASFNGTNGSWPAGGVTLDASGNLYGTTYHGGTGNDDGTVFEVAKGSGTITTLASFNGTNGAEPDAGVTLDASGNLYGTTEDGGASNDGTVFEIARGSGTITILLSFDGANGASPSAEVTLDASGNLYGTTSHGGSSGDDGTVFELTPNTAVSLSLTSGTSTSTFVQPLTFTVAVSGGVPDGQAVTLIDASNGDAVVATGTVIGGSATLLVPGGTLSAGTHQLIAVYAGDATHAASESAPLLQSVLAASYRPVRSP